MAEYMIHGETLTAIADAIRAKGEFSGSLTPAGMVTAVENISVGVDTSDATAAAGDILSGKTAYVDGEKITGTIATKTSSNLTASGATVNVPAGYYASAASKSVVTATQATPSITVSTTGLITASSTQNVGYVTAGTQSATQQLTTQAAKTITPGTSTKTAVASGVYTTGAVKVKGDANLVAKNIASGVSIFGVVGSCEATIIEGSFTPSAVTNLKFGSIPITGLGGKPKSVFIMHNNVLTTGTQPYSESGEYNKYLVAIAKFDDIVYSSSVYRSSKLYFTSEISATPTLFNLTLDNDGFTLSNGTDGGNVYAMNSGYRYFAIM